PAPLEPPSRRMLRRRARGLGRWGMAYLAPPEREGVDEVRAARREPRGMLRTSLPPEAEEASLAFGAGELRQQLHRLVELLRPEDLPLAASLLRRLLRGAPEH
ncbi:MAG TPA: hypothetical protein VNO79_14590, partial [Actinomycetota bacterium]|nr:hypothetical protein [Actinomycetota bacterium]